jgi:hypothetical protein
MAEITNKPNHGNKPPHGHDDSNAQISFERRDVNVFQISAFGIGLLLATIVVIFAMWALFAFLTHREDEKNPAGGQMASQKQTIPPEPRLSGVRVENGKLVQPTYPRVELAELVQDEQVILDSYGTDPATGKTRIPIAQAMAIVSQPGKLPVKASPAGSDNGGYRTIPSVASSGRTLEKIAQ